MTEYITGKEFERFTKRLYKDLDKISLNIDEQNKLNEVNQPIIDSFKNFKRRTIQLVMAFLLSSASIAAKYTFEDKPVLEVKTEAKKDG